MEQRRTMVTELMATVGRRERCLCRWLGFHRRAVRYRPLRPADTALRQRLRELATVHPRWGLPMLTWCLWQEGVRDNHKRLRRLYALTLVDDCTRECLVIEVGTSLGGAAVVAVLDRLAVTRGRPTVLVTDNGPELQGRALAGGVPQPTLVSLAGRCPTDH